MSEKLKITTLGGLSVHHNDKPVKSFVSRKVDALLVYLAANPREHPREVLGEMLWDDLPQNRTMSYLRTALSSLQQQLAPFLIVTRQTLSINPESDYWLDVIELEQILNASETEWSRRDGFSRMTARRLEAALELYKGPFLDGFHIRDARGFEGWMVLEQERLKNRVLEALYRLGSFTLRRGLYSSGIAHTTQALQLDPMSEKAHRLMMQMLARSGQRSAALAQFEQCQTILEEELGVEPEDETIELYEQIIAGEMSAEDEIATPHNLPTLATPFIDRPIELAQIIEQMDKPECRLLTLAGPGGIGKTRLALEAARQLLLDFSQGVYFVPFAPTTTPANIARTIASALSATFRGDIPLEDELIRFLHDQEILLVLDGFEHLVEGAASLSNILQGAPHVKILLTSRERLNLHEEWLYPVEALRVPARADVPKAESSPAVQLFVQGVQRVQPEFTFADAPEAIIRICKLVEGMPLGIELAASWVRVMTPSQIINEIQNSLDFLTSSLRNIPERHRSIRAVFDSSWKMLNEEEQRVLRQISVFQGGFHQRAAQKVVGAALPVLSSLVDKSLLSPVDGRYQIHELLRQYAMDKLDPQEHEQMLDTHCRYFANFLHTRDSELTNNRPGSAYEEVTHDFDNVVAAWQYALQHGARELIGRFLRPAYRIFDIESRYQDGERLFRTAAKHLGASLDQENDFIQAQALALLAACLQSMAQYDEAETIATAILPTLRSFGEQALWETRITLACIGGVVYARGEYERAQEVFEEAYKLSLQTAGDPVIYLLRLSDIALVLGEYEKSRRILEEALSFLEDSGGRQSRMRFLLTLGDINIKIGNFAEALTNFQEALELSEQLDAQTSRAVALVSLGRVAYGQGNYDASRAYCEESIAICDQIRNLWGKAFAFIHLGKATFALGNFAEAKHHYRTSLHIADEVKSPWLVTATLNQLSQANQRLGDVDEARQDLHRSLHTALEIHALPLAMEAMSTIGHLYAAQGDDDRAAELATFVLQQPFTEYEARQNTLRLLETLEDRISAESMNALKSQTSSQALDEVVNSILSTA